MPYPGKTKTRTHQSDFTNESFVVPVLDTPVLSGTYYRTYVRSTVQLKLTLGSFFSTNDTTHVFHRRLLAGMKQHFHFFVRDPRALSCKCALHGHPNCFSPSNIFRGEVSGQARIDGRNWLMDGRQETVRVQQPLDLSDRQRSTGTWPFTAKDTTISLGFHSLPWRIHQHDDLCIF
jgi:hypothetical protein